MSHSFPKVPSWLVAVILLGMAVFMAGLDRTPVPTVDGAIRAVMAREIHESGRWYPTTYLGEVFIDHPPLYVWLEALMYKVFGVSDFAANLPGRFFAFLTVLFTALLCVEIGFGTGVAILAALILCCTRDFVLSSVRGYIEPLIEAFTYGGLWLVLKQLKVKRPGFFQLPAFLAGVCIFFIAFSKGPPAAWPFLLFAVLFLRTPHFLLSYFLGFAACVAVWAEANSALGLWPYWKMYFNDQLFASAVHGRGGAQDFERAYFLKILFKFYWPWLPLLIWGFWDSYKERDSNRALFAVLGLGFVGGFSLVRWKFWYYITPAYPAFAILIAATIGVYARNVQKKSQAIAQWVSGAALLWIFLVSVFPIELHRERVPEVMQFKATIRNSTHKGPVLFWHDRLDHNQISTSGAWYFGKPVLKLSGEIKEPAWIIASEKNWKTCALEWCKRSLPVQKVNDTVLLLHR